MNTAKDEMKEVNGLKVDFGAIVSIPYGQFKSLESAHFDRERLKQQIAEGMKNNADFENQLKERDIKIAELTERVNASQDAAADEASLVSAIQSAIGTHGTLERDDNDSWKFIPAKAAKAEKAAPAKKEAAPKGSKKK